MIAAHAPRRSRNSPLEISSVADKAVFLDRLATSSLHAIPADHLFFLSSPVPRRYPCPCSAAASKE